jgi:hypothetical protein
MCQDCHLVGRDKSLWNIDGTDESGESELFRGKKTCPVATLAVTDPTCTTLVC